MTKNKGAINWQFLLKIMWSQASFLSYISWTERPKVGLNNTTFKRMLCAFHFQQYLENISLVFTHFSERRRIGSTCSRGKSRKNVPFLDDNKWMFKNYALSVLNGINNPQKISIFSSHIIWSFILQCLR